MDRRKFLASSAALTLAAYPTHLSASARALPKGKIIVVILEGGMDGLAAVPATGDPFLRRARPSIELLDAIPLNSLFGLHPSLHGFAQLLAKGQAAIIHATALPYTLRSHFDGQNIGETGLESPFATETGWLGRAMDLASISGRALSLDLPLILRGDIEVDSYYPANLAGSDTPNLRLLELLAQGQASDVADGLKKLAIRSGQAQSIRARDNVSLARVAGQSMSQPDGPSAAVLRVPEFDTHASQGTSYGQIASCLRSVDEIFVTLEQSLGETWSDTIVMTITEFGRTVGENGSEGTDHGYGSVGLLAGGLLKNSAFIADWPGLAPNNRFEGRDLLATIDYRSVCAACIEAAFQIPHDEIATLIFKKPDLMRLHDRLFN